MRSPDGRCVGASQRALGKTGEDAAAAWYESRGYEIVARNWSCREGELDIVARRGRLVVFCEVKARSSGAFGLPVEAVGALKQARVRRLAALWFAEQAAGCGSGAGARRGGPVRFDVVSVPERRGRGDRGPRFSSLSLSPSSRSCLVLRWSAGASPSCPDVAGPASASTRCASAGANPGRLWGPRPRGRPRLRFLAGSRGKGRLSGLGAHVCGGHPGPVVPPLRRGRRSLVVPPT